MKKTILFLWLGLWSVTGSTQTLKIWEGTSMTRKQKRSELTVYLPENDKNTGISLIVCPGGSYCYLGIHREGHRVARWLQSRGIAAFVLRYRVGMYGNHHPAMIQDLQRAIQLVRKKSALWGLDTNKVGAMGFSAGGHLVGTAGIYYRENFMQSLGIRPEVSLRPDFMAMIYPVVSMEDSIVHRKSRRNLLGPKYKLESAARMSLEQHVHPDMPPVFLLHCQDDRTVKVENSRVLDRKLKQQGVKCKVCIYKKGNHGFGLYPGEHTDSHGWCERFEEWLQKVVFSKK